MAKANTCTDRRHTKETTPGPPWALQWIEEPGSQHSEESYGKGSLWAASTIKRDTLGLIIVLDLETCRIFYVYRQGWSYSSHKKSLEGNVFD